MAAMAQEWQSMGEMPLELAEGEASTIMGEADLLARVSAIEEL